MMKRFKLICFLLVLFLLSFVNVYAEDKVECKSMDNIDYFGQYGVELKESKTDSNRYVLSMIALNKLNKDESYKNAIKNIVFTVTAINGNTSSTVNPGLIGKQITFNTSIGGIVGEFDDDETMTIELISTEKDVDPYCYGNVYAYVSFSTPCSSGECAINENFFSNAEDLPIPTIQSDKLLSESCVKGVSGGNFQGVQATKVEEKRFDKGSFEQKFCEMYDLTGVRSTNHNKSLKCDYTKYANSSSDDYFTNQAFFYDYSEDTIEEEEATYVMHYDFTRSEDVGKATCTRKCEEVVAVEYGPPIASLGGVCFEYKVRVTSLVNCTTTKVTPPPSKERYSVCTPYPKCWHAGVRYDQGGPSDEFDSCIKKCDNGKYTEKCSKKCYKKVYGKSYVKDLSNMFDVSYADKLISPGNGVEGIQNKDSNFNFEACASYVNVDPSRGLYQDNNDGCYYNAYKRNENGEIVYDSNGKAVVSNIILWAGKYVNRTGKNRGYNRWNGQIRANPGYENDTVRYLDPTYGKEIYSAGRWYLYGNHKSYHNYYGTGTYAVPYDDGFYRHILGYETYCGDACYWHDCGGDVYLNYGFAEKDKERNDSIYLKTLNKCKAAASCSEKTAEITMSVDYSVKSGGKTVPKTINFPYTESNSSDNKDLISSKGVKDNPVDTSVNANSTIIKGSNLGCYKDESIPSLYQLTILFPGSWENRKGDGFKYVPQDLSDYKYYDKKFCIPYSALDVNQDWDHYVSYLEIKRKETPGNTIEINSPAYKLCASDLCKNSYAGCSIPVSGASSYSWDYFKNSSNTEDDFHHLISDKIDYNIHAKINNFGYFGWDINVDCFYSLSHDPECSNNISATTNNSCPCDKTPGETEYRIRTVDLKCLFPSENDSCSSYDNSVETVDRIHGYNWTDYAIINKDSGTSEAYTSTPSFIVDEIQTKGYAIYEDSSQLDYEFKFTPSLIKEIKNSDYKYGSYSSSYLNNIENTYKDSKIQMYYSKAFRDGGPLSAAVVHIPASKLIPCNNMLNATAGEGGSCEPTSR